MYYTAVYHTVRFAFYTYDSYRILTIEKKIATVNFESNLNTVYRSSHRRCSAKNFAKFTGKHLCQGLFFNNVAG